MTPAEPSEMDISPAGYQALAEFRYQIRSFLHFSDEAARASGIEPQQHQLLLAIKGLPPDQKATVGTLAERLQLRHHSTVELINRTAERGLVERAPGQDDRRQILVNLTPHGEGILRNLSLAHHAELASRGPALAKALAALLRKARESVA